MGDMRDILIAGGGLNGSTLALALAQAGFTVTLVDGEAAGQQDNPDFDGRAYALALGSQRMLTSLGLWSDIGAQAQPILDIVVSDGHVGRGGALGLHFDHAEIEEGPMGFLMEDRFLRRALQEAVANADGVQVLRGTHVVSHSPAPAHVDVTLSDDTRTHARLLIGADGRRSDTAQRAGIRRTGWSYQQRALVCAVSHERAHNGVAHQFFMPEGPLAILPLPGNRSSIVWTNPLELAADINAMTDADYLAALAPRFGDFLGQIELAGMRFSYPLDLSVAQAFVSDRVALIGDAAHAVHPIAGQGLNAGLKDVAALAHVVVDAKRRGEDIGAGDVLERYQRWRRFDAMTLAVATDAFNRLFSNDNPVLRAARGYGMGLVQSTAGLRRGFIREAAGLTGDLPYLMRGQP